MNVHLPAKYGLLPAVPENRMGRFFSSTNLARYRKLAYDEIAAAERDLILKTLAEEWSAFMRECWPA